MGEPTYDILIPTAGPIEDIIKCLESVRKYSQDYRVIWLSNGAPYELKCVAKATLQGMPHIALEVDKNLGPAKGHNILLAYSTAPYVVILNDDTEVVPAWLEGMRRLFDKESVGIAASCVDNGGGWQLARAVDAPKNGELLDVPMIFPYCAMFSRECLDKVGYFSEEYFSGWDQDYCFRARKLGFRLAVDLRTVIKHRWHGTINTFSGSDRDASYKKDVALLKKYHGEFY